MTEEKNTIIDAENQLKKNDEPVKLKGKYVATTGKRKTSVARVRLYKNGNGYIIVNGEKASNYFENDKANVIKQPLKTSGHLRDLNISVVVCGGGKMSQAVAVRHAISRALIEFDSELKPALKSKGWTTRDSRKKERKKPGLKRARRAPQWNKR